MTGTGGLNAGGSSGNDWSVVADSVGRAQGVDAADLAEDAGDLGDPERRAGRGTGSRSRGWSSAVCASVAVNASKLPIRPPSIRTIPSMSW